MTTRIALLLLATLGCSSSSLTESPTAPPVAPDPLETSTKDEAYRVGLFGLDLYDALRGTSGNLVLSPTSVATALHAAHGVASPDEADVIARQLAYISHDPARDIAAVGRLSSELESASTSYDADVRLERGDRLRITSDARYRAAWAHAFAPEGTTQAVFATPKGPIEVPMMSMANPLRYAHTDGVQLVELPFADKRFDFVVILPDDAAAFADREHAFATYDVMDWLKELAPGHQIAVSLPRFTIDANLDLLPAFGEISNHQLDALFLEATHRTSLSIDEFGASAQATTVLVAGAEVDHVVRADRPFLWLIRERATGAIVFLGRVVAPASQA